VRMGDIELERWNQTWQRAATALDDLRRRELQAMTDDDVRRAINEVFSVPFDFAAAPARISGLVEQQRLFALLPRKT
jgi:hypothetical protein